MSKREFYVNLAVICLGCIAGNAIFEAVMVPVPDWALFWDRSIFQVAALSGVAITGLLHVWKVTHD